MRKLDAPLNPIGRGPLFLVIPLLWLGVLLFALFPPDLQPFDEPNDHARVVAFPAIADYMTINNGVDHILAVTEATRKDAVSGLQGRIYPSVARLPQLFVSRADPALPSDPEQLLALAPTVVLAWSWTSHEFKRLGLPIIDIGPLASGASSIAMWRQFADVADQKGRGEELIDDYRSEIASLDAEIAGLPRLKPATAIAMTKSNDRIFVENRLFLDAEDISAAGGRNVAADLVSTLTNVEQLFKLDPDAIFLTSMLKGPQNTPQQIYADPILRVLSAAAHRRVYMLPALTHGLVDRPLLLRWMAELIRPGQMDKTFRARFRQRYREIYRYDLKDGEIDQAIHLKENLISAGYERFLPRMGS